MIISRGRRFVFVHIPKTGGTAMALALEARAMKDDILIGDTPKARARRSRLKGLQSRGRLWKHSTLADIDGVVTPDELADWFSFTFVRNPWDRAVSYYHWLKAQSFDHPAVGLAKALNFPGFLNHPQTQASLSATPAHSYMTAANGVEYCSAYIRLEHLAHDLAPLEQHLGFGLVLPHANQSDRKRDWRPYYTDQTASLMAQLCATDINRFGYTFDDVGRPNF
jgi:hypothetical protein